MEQFLPQLPFFSGLTEADVSAFLKSSRVQEYKKHDTIFQQGDKAIQFFAVLDGWVKLCRPTPEGDEAVITILQKGDVFGEAAIFNSADYRFNAVAAENTKLITISGATLRERAQHNHEIIARVMAAMSREMQNLQMENEHMALMSAPQRVGCLLLQMSVDVPGQSGTFTFPYDKSLAASRLGMKPETFSRALAQLKPLGVTVKGSDIHIESFSGLINYCCSHCSSLPGECSGSRQCTERACCSVNLVKLPTFK